MADNRFRVHGRIVDQETGRGLPGLRVEAVDQNSKPDERLGVAITDPDGSFELVYDRADFRKLYINLKPELYLRVKTAAGQTVLTARNKLRYGARAARELVLELPAAAARGELRRGGRRRGVHVTVFNHRDRPLRSARVTLRPLGGREVDEVRLRYDPARGVFHAAAPEPGRYYLRAAAANLEPDAREITVGPDAQIETFVLGPRGLSILYRGKVRVPVKLPEDLLALTLTDPETDARLFDEADRLGLKPVNVAAAVRRENVRVFRLRGAVSRAARLRTQQALAAIPGVRLVGPVVKLTGRGVSYLTNELVVSFKKSSVPDERAADMFLERYALTIVRTIPYADAFLARTANPADYEVLEISKRIVETGHVEYAEPHLVITSEDHQVIPTDYQYPAQWTHPLIELPEAWQLVKNQIGVSAFGDPNVVIAVMDQGIQSHTQGGVTKAAHPDFAGTVSDGKPKVAAFFDFRTMVPNNDAPPHKHGMGCAGVAAALANNGPPVDGVHEGIAGAAGNCQVMALIRPAGLEEILYADAYVWAAGLNPGWTSYPHRNRYKAGTVFPATLAKGADIITSSFGTGLPISGPMAAAIESVTSSGRGGLGCCLFFSVGNDNSPMGDQQAWASHDRAMAVAASTLDPTGKEVRASYSNFGPAVDFCAPSSSSTGSASHNPPAAYGVISADLVDHGDLIGQPLTKTTLGYPAPIHGSNAGLTVASAVGLAKNRRVQILPPGTAKAESPRIYTVNANKITVAKLLNDHDVGTAVATGARNYTANFGGTSAAAPLAAGVAALMLSVNPNLSWRRVRWILINTAEQIDHTQSNVNGQWIDEDGDGVVDHSQWYGAGRINARAAVQAAISRIGQPLVAGID
jgi:subtilisin family serine protease